MCTDNPVRNRDYTEEFEHASRDIGYYTHIHIYIYMMMMMILSLLALK